MATAENARLQYEAGQSSTAMVALTDSGNSTTFTSSASLWSGRSGYTPVVRLNGVLTGGDATPTAVNNQVSVSALTANLNGAVAAVASGLLTASRGTGADVARITSITLTAAGALAAVAGTASAAIVETRGVAGGPPVIPVDSIELAQVRLTSTAAAPVTTAEVQQVIGVHRQFAGYPLYTIDYATGKITFASALSGIHTAGAVPKVYASFAAPIFADVALASDFVPPETTHSVSSLQVYGATIGSSSSTLNQGSFTAYLNDGVTDPLVTLKNEILWFRFYPDKLKTPNVLCQGKLGVGRAFPAADQIAAACTISATSAALEVA